MKIQVNHEQGDDWHNKVEVSIRFDDVPISAADFVKLQDLVRQIEAVTQPYFEALASPQPQEKDHE